MRGVTLSNSAPANSQVELDTSVPGIARIVFTSPTVLPTGRFDFAMLDAHVPSDQANDIYLHKQLLDVRDLRVTGDEEVVIPAVDNDALQVTMYLADVSGNGRINALDASLIARVVSQLDVGFAATLLGDPNLIGDVSGNSLLNAADASFAAEVAAGISLPQVPAIPTGLVTREMLGPDPRLYVGQATSAPGGQVMIPIAIDSILDLPVSERMTGGTLALKYDATVLTYNITNAGTFITSRPGWSFVVNDQTRGELVIVFFGPQPDGGRFVQ